MGGFKELSLILIIGCLAIYAEKTSGDTPRVINGQDLRLLINPLYDLFQTTTAKPETPAKIIIKPSYNYPPYPHYPNEEYYPSYRPPYRPYPTRPSYPAYHPTKPTKRPTKYPHPPVYTPSYPQYPSMYPQYPPMYPYYPQPTYGYYPWYPQRPRPRPPVIVVIRPPPTKKPDDIDDDDDLLDLPDLPDLPGVSRPTLPSVTRPTLPSVTRPTLPSVTTPTLPSVTKPTLTIPTIIPTTLPNIIPTTLPNLLPTKKHAENRRVYNNYLHYGPKNPLRSHKEDELQTNTEQPQYDYEEGARNIELNGDTTDSEEVADTIAIATKDIKLPFDIQLSSHPRGKKKSNDQEALIYLRNYKNGRTLKSDKVEQKA